MSSLLIKYLKDIRFWILFFFVLRLYGITNPPLEAGTCWRQCDVLMIARNFYEKDSNILYPRVDFAVTETGIVAPEFPILNYLIYLLSLPFGFHDWFGRLLNLTISSVGIFFFYKSIRKYFDEEVAFNSSLVVLVSLWFTFSREAMPDTFAASLCFVAIFFGLRFFEKGKIQDLLIYLLFALIGGLAKISTLTLLTVFAVPVLNSAYTFRRKISFIFCSFLVLTGIFLWYFYWVPFLSKTFGYGGHFFMGQSFAAGLSQLSADWPGAFKRIYDTAMKYSGFVCFVMGLFLVISRRNWLLLIVFLLPFVSFLFVIVNSGVNFIVNGYYPLVLIPSMALMAGSGLASLPNKKIALFLLIFVGVEGIANQIHVLEIRYPLKTLEKLEPVIDELKIPKDAQVVTNWDSSEDPTPLYFAHRRGLNIPDIELKSTDRIEDLRRGGFKYIIIIKYISTVEVSMNSDVSKIFDSPDFTIYQL